MTLSATVSQSNSAGDWKTSARSGPGGAIGRPFTITLPEVGTSNPATSLRIVVLPQPDGPTTATISRASTTRSTLSSATNGDWPRTDAKGEEAPGVGFRGGAEYFAPQPKDNPTNPRSPTAVRTYAGWGGAGRYKTYSARGGRTAD